MIKKCVSDVNWHQRSMDYVATRLESWMDSLKRAVDSL